MFIFIFTEGNFFFLCLPCKSLTSWKGKAHYITPYYSKCGIFIYLFLFLDLWYYLSKLIINKSSYFHLIFGIFFFYFQSLFNLCESCYSYPEACHFVTNLKYRRGSSNQSRAKLSEGKYWWIHPTIPHGMCFRAICWAICRLYHGHWYWFVCSFLVLMSPLYLMTLLCTWV